MNFKSIDFVVLVAALSFGLAACGSDSSSGPQEASAPVGSSESVGLSSSAVTGPQTSSENVESSSDAAVPESSSAVVNPPSSGQMQPVTGYGYSAKSLIYQFLCLIKPSGKTVIGHAANHKTVRITPLYISKIVILESVNELLYHNGGSHLRIVHVGEENLGGITSVNDERRHHLTHLTHEQRPAVLQRAYGHAVYNGVLTQPQM